MGKLTIKRIESIIKLGGQGKTGDGDGLYLQISRAGVASWIYRYKVGNKGREMGLGPYPAVGLADARGLAADQRKVRAGGGDPLDRRNSERVAQRTAEAKALSHIISFRNLALEYREAQGGGWTPKWFKGWLRKLDLYAFDIIGEMPAAEIQTSHVLQILRPIWVSKTRTADEVRGSIEQVLDYAKAHGRRDGENPARWRGHLENTLSKAAKKQARLRTHFPAMDWRNAPKLMADLALHQIEASDSPKFASRDAAATRLLILTGARSHMIRFASWSEIDLENSVWRVPAEKMKSRQAFDIPLPPLVVELIRNIPRIVDNPWLFPGAGKSGVIHANAMRELLHSMGHRDITRHGFRSSFRNWASERTNFSREVCEMVLAHDERGDTERAYNHTDYLDKRRSLMLEWSTYLCTHVND